MASDSIFESFPSYPQCFMRGEYTLVFSYLLLLSSADNEMAAWWNSGQFAPAGSVCFVEGIQTRAHDYKAIGLLIHQVAALQRCFNK